MHFYRSIFGLGIFILGPTPALADESTTIPRCCDVDSITIFHQRDENAYVALGSDRKSPGVIVYENEIGELTNQTKQVPVNFDGQLFGPSSRDYTARVGGRWSGGHWQGWVKSIVFPQDQVVRLYPDREEIQLFTGERDPYWNTAVVIKFKSRCFFGKYFKGARIHHGVPKFEIGPVR